MSEKNIEIEIEKTTEAKNKSIEPVVLKSDESENQEENLTEQNETLVNEVETTSKLPEETSDSEEIIEQEKSIEENKDIINEAETRTEIPDVVSDSEEKTEEEQLEKEIQVSSVKKDYQSLTLEELVDEFRSLITNFPIQKTKNQVEEIRSVFKSSFKKELEKNKEEFLSNGGNIIEFSYSSPHKKVFNSLFREYKDKVSIYYKELTKDLKANLENRLELIEELKGLLNAEENINTTYKHFKDIQERWFNAGPIPRDNYNIVWNTYRHHVENFYDFLHLNRKFRDLDFKHNLEEKLKLIERVEKLKEEENINKAFRELQQLHKMWKEEIGPVAKEFREEIWDKFSAATKIIHDKRHDYLKDMDLVFEENYNKKVKLIDEISAVSQNTKNSHQSWQKSIKEVQNLRDQFFNIGRVPRSKNKEIWSLFKETTREFNKLKNLFYKDQKKDQHQNLSKKLELIKIAEENKDNDDFELVTPLMKKIQNDWKNIGHVPRKDSDRIWKQFKGACNFYFDRLNLQKDESNKEEINHLELKEEYLKNLKSLKLDGDNKEDIKMIKEKINEWKEIGRVPYNKRNIEQMFNKALDGLFNKLDLNKKETELIKFENRISSFDSQEDLRKIQNEEIFINKKIGEFKGEIRQLENNLGFFQHVDENNPMVRDVNKNINRQKEDLEVWKAKLKKIRKLRKG